ncbi:MAG: hypothetical protein H6718_11575 [Polyangiaceae bacterium]|nr:hypothetical protein [Polyangiaceae bacterium]
MARLTLDQYARVNLALTLVRLPPDSVFAAEQITADEWEALKAPIEQRLMEADVDDPFQDEYSAASESALGHFSRALPPLDSDAHAWFAFLKAYGESSDPPLVLRQLGLLEVDLMNLNALWARQLPALEPAQRSQALGAPAALPNIHVETMGYPPVGDPIGPLRQLQVAPPEEPEAAAVVPVFAPLPSGEDED